MPGVQGGQGAHASQEARPAEARRLPGLQVEVGLTPVPKVRRIVNRSLIKALLRHVRRCEWCGVVADRTPWPLDPHHIKSRGAGGGDTLDNLVVLCRPCHDQAQTYKIHRAALIAITGSRQRDPFWQAIARQAAKDRGSLTSASRGLASGRDATALGPTGEPISSYALAPDRLS